MKYTKTELDSIIKESIRECLKRNTDFHKTDTLVLTTYSILKSIFIDEKKYVFLEAPTGSGKSVIAYLTHFCYVYVKNKIEGIDVFTEENKLSNLYANTYLLTSSKMLQEQLDNDITKFDLSKYVTMLKGIKNYSCVKLTEETKIYHDYSERFCMGMNTIQKESLECYSICPYLQKRNEASLKDVSILNYSYFLNVLKNNFSPFFKTRSLTIADEAHLIPDIVLGMYNIVLTQYTLNKLLKFVNQIDVNFNKDLKDNIFDIRNDLGNLYKYFQLPKPNLQQTKDYLDLLKDIIKSIIDIDTLFVNNKVFQSLFEKDFKKLKDDLKFMDYDDYIESLSKRPNDTFIKSENVGHFATEAIGTNPAGSYTIYRHTIYDLSESELCRKYFITKVDTCVFMSATLGNMDEFAVLMGLKKDEYEKFRLESNFNFDNSPINLVNSGYLNYNNFNKNIDKVLLDTLRISENIHGSEKGIIHTSTFVIANLLKQKILNKQGGVVNPKRYLFYESAEEKESCIELMKANTNIPYVVVGPSLYEGLDLKNEQGRFNILVKVPYSGIDDYTRNKMERYEFWYNRQTLEKITQAIGRTNRHVDDYSKTYLMDSGFDKIIMQMSEFMTNRIKYFKLY